MTTAAYYNEIDPYAAEWLRNLITQGLIAPGVVDTRSIEDVQPSDLADFTQCHFFAGIGVWSLALRRAGWPDDRPVWTGSCPCQPFSAAGKGAAFADERHLWPAFGHLIRERKPPVVLGEQVASAAVDDWIDLVHADLEAMGYAFGSVPFPSASVGAPHIRDRNYWAGVALGDAGSKGLDKRGRIAGISIREGGAVAGQTAVGAGIHSVRLADCHTAGAARHGSDGRSRAATSRIRNGSSHRGEPSGMADDNGIGFGAHAVAALRDAEHHPESRGGIRGLGNSNGGPGRQGGALDGGRDQRGDAQSRTGLGGDGVSHTERPGPTNGFWRDADWLGCTDGKWRPVESGTFPLAHGATARVGRLRAYGNAINAEQARIFIECVMEAA